MWERVINAYRAASTLPGGCCADTSYFGLEIRVIDPLRCSDGKRKRQTALPHWYGCIFSIPKPMVPPYVISISIEMSVSEGLKLSVSQWSRYVFNVLKQLIPPQVGSSASETPILSHLESAASQWSHCNLDRLKALISLHDNSSASEM
jgi:hypothetical protein